MRDHHTAYDLYATDRCERVLLTLLGDVGPWSERIYLAGGLAPRYLVGRLPDGAGAHVGTTDVDLIVGLALGDEAPETYRTLHNNLNNAGFEQIGPSFRWSRTVDGASVGVCGLSELCRRHRRTTAPLNLWRDAIGRARWPAPRTGPKPSSTRIRRWTQRSTIYRGLPGTADAPPPVRSATGRLDLPEISFRCAARSRRLARCRRRPVRSAILRFPKQASPGT